MGIAEAALTLAILSLVYSLYTGRHNRELTKSTLKSNLLTKIVELQIHYQNRINEIKKLIYVAEIEMQDKFDEFNQWLKKAEEYNKKAQGYYNAIQSSKSLNSAELENIRHHIEALIKDLEQMSKDMSKYEPLLDEYIMELRKTTKE